MNVLMLSAEVAPFATVGGLSQVLFFLSKSLVKAGHDVRIFSPLHGKIKQRIYKPHSYIRSLIVPTDTKKRGIATSVECAIKLYKTKKPWVYFVENREYYTLRENVFGYADDHVRFYLMCKACLEWLVYQQEHKEWMPDIIHAHDWHAGYFVELARTNKRYAKVLNTIPILYSVHNFHYQGSRDFAYLPPKERDNAKKRLPGMLDPTLGEQNALLRGITHADWINTVSPSHAIEVLTPQYGEGLDQFLNKKKSTLSGILNGLDIVAFDPATDPLIAQNYSQTTIEKRAGNKLALQKAFHLTQGASIPILAYSGRLVQQKGIHLFLEIAEYLLKEINVQIIILGGGEASITQEVYTLAGRHPSKMGVHLYPNFKLPRLIFAGADAIMLPSIFEPGGIVALEAMRYGCIPIARRTGGLADIIRDFDPTTKTGNGFSFEHPTGIGLLIARSRAFETYRNHKLWQTLVSNAMKEDFSWDYSMREYLKLYKKTMTFRKHAILSNPSPAFIATA